jgi:hypothetical protein
MEGKLNWQTGLYYEKSMPGSLVGGIGPSTGITCQTAAFEALDELRCRGGVVNISGGKVGFINIAGYYNDLSNQQLQVSLQPMLGTNGSSRTSIFNAGRSRIKGVEADASLRFGRFFRLEGSVNRLMTKLISIDLPPFPNFTAIPTADKGSGLSFSPKWSANMSATAVGRRGQWPDRGAGTLSLPVVLPQPGGIVDRSDEHAGQAARS